MIAGFTQMLLLATPTVLTQITSITRTTRIMGLEAGVEISMVKRGGTDFPNHLQIYLSNRCNLSCSYCYVAVNEGPSKRLGFLEIARGISYFLSQAGPSSRITFLGGEPLLDFPLLRRSIDYIRDQTQFLPPVSLFTNGVFLSPDKLEYFRKQKVRVILSLDGRKATNDTHRVFFQNRTQSVFDSVSAIIQDLPRGSLDLNMVFTALTVKDLVKNVDFFYRLGFKRIDFYPALYEDWSAAQLRVLRKIMQDMEAYYVSLFSEVKAQPFAMQGVPLMLQRRLQGERGEVWWRDCRNLVLGSDGGFHVCDKALSFRFGEAKGSIIGNPQVGVNWQRRSRMYSQAKRQIYSDDRSRKEYFFCPMGSYFHSQWSKKSAAEALLNFQKVTELFSGFFFSVADRLKRNDLFRQIYPGLSEEV